MCTNNWNNYENSEKHHNLPDKQSVIYVTQFWVSWNDRKRKLLTVLRHNKVHLKDEFPQNLNSTMIYIHSSFESFYMFVCVS